MSEESSEKNKNSTAKAVGIGGGSGIGAILLNLSEFIPDEITKRTLQSAIPLFSIGMTSVFSFICEVYLIDPVEYKKQRKLKKIKQKLLENINDVNLDDSARARAREQYSLVCQMESNFGISSTNIVSTVPQSSEANPNNS